MTKSEILDVIKLLSQLEAWSFAENHMLPDHILKSLDKQVEFLSIMLLENKDE